jgi:hypothetical protein
MEGFPLSKPIVKQVLERAHALVSASSTWTRYTLAMTGNHRECDPTDARAARFCGYGALVRAAFELTADEAQARRLAGQVAMRATGHATPVEAYEEIYGINDGPPSSSRRAVALLFEEALARV